jgi:Eco29kI restriction endonuclease
MESYNPLDRENLGKSIVDALLNQEAVPLNDIPDFPGAGVYAIYYRGDFEPYLPLSRTAVDHGWHYPIYVGKAVPPGGRKGIQDESMACSKLSDRLLEHKSSILAASNLKIECFWARHLVVEDIWIPLGESLLIQKYLPLWNLVVEGFGNHDPGAGRYNGRRPMWDELHPGRDWALRCAPPKVELQEILALVQRYMERFQ